MVVRRESLEWPKSLLQVVSVYNSLEYSEEY